MFLIVEKETPFSVPGTGVGSCGICFPPFSRWLFFAVQPEPLPGNKLSNRTSWFCGFFFSLHTHRKTDKIDTDTRVCVFYLKGMVPTTGLFSLVPQLSLSFPTRPVKLGWTVAAVVRSRSVWSTRCWCCESGPLIGNPIPVRVNLNGEATPEHCVIEGKPFFIFATPPLFSKEELNADLFSFAARVEGGTQHFYSVYSSFLLTTTTRGLNLAVSIAPCASHVPYRGLTSRSF